MGFDFCDRMIPVLQTWLTTVTVFLQEEMKCQV